MMEEKEPKIMGVLNMTPDSFSDGGMYLDARKALARIYEMIEEGVDIIDIGAESTRPDSAGVTVDEELNRLALIIQHIAGLQLEQKTMFSIDTYKADVAEHALRHGFQYVNDVTALRGDSAMASILLAYQPYIILMYSKDPSARTTRRVVEYDDVVGSVKEFLRERINFLTKKGFPKEKIIIDPGMGLFLSPDPKYSFDMIERLSELKELGCPILVGISRKTFLGATLDDSDHASAAWSMEAIHNGASIVRVHDVQMMHDVLHYHLLPT